MEQIKYRSLEQTEASITRLSKIQWPAFNVESSIEDFIEQVERILYAEFDYIPMIIRKNEKFGLPFFRVRELNSFSNIDLFQEHSYPPLQSVKMQRCNFPKTPVFYCSINPLIALKEVIRNNDYAEKKYCITKWEINKGSEIASQSFLQVSLHSRNEFEQLKNDEKQKVKEIFGKNLNDSQVEGLVKYWEFLNEMFVSDNYALSATLAHRSLFGNSPITIDVLIYPSIQSDSITANFAINPNFVNQRMTISRAYLVETLNYEESTGKVDISILKFGRVENNRFIWNAPNDEHYQKAYEEDFEHMVV